MTTMKKSVKSIVGGRVGGGVSGVLMTLLLSAVLMLQVSGQSTVWTAAGNGNSNCDEVCSMRNNELQPYLGLGSGVTDIAFDSDSIAYYAVRDCNVILKHNFTSNNVSLFAGNPTNRGDYGDNNLALAAFLDHPVALTVDPDEWTLYVAEGSGILRGISLHDTHIWHVGGVASPDDGDWDSNSLDTVYLGNITNLFMNESRYIFVTDTVSRLRLIDLWYRTIVTYAGTTNMPGSMDGAALSATFDLPNSLGGDRLHKKLYVYDEGTCAFRVVDIPTRTVSTWWGGYQCDSTGDGNNITAASAAGHVKICGTDSRGDFYFAETQNCIIRKVSADGNVVSKVAGTNCSDWSNYATEGTQATWTPINLRGGGCTVHKDVLYFSDFSHGSRVRMMTLIPPVSPSLSPAGYPTYSMSPSAAPSPSAVGCHWSGEDDSCDGALEEVVVSSSTSSSGYVDGQYTTTTTTITRTYKKRSS